MKYLMLLALAITMLQACAPETTDNEATEANVDATNEATIQQADAYVVIDEERVMVDSFIGEQFSVNGAMSYDALLASNKMSEEQMPSTVYGTVTDVCQVKGCWITMQPDNGGEPLNVKFKDYAFFMPKDLSGKRVVLNGMAYTETTSVDELRHYAEDGGSTKAEIEAITEPEKQMKFMASGVALLAEK